LNAHRFVSSFVVGRLPAPVGWLVSIDLSFSFSLSPVCGAVGWLVFSFFHESQIASFFFYLLGIPFIPATVAESKLFFAGDCYRQFPFCVFNSGVSGLSASVVHHRVQSPV
jgi:hypothetical protein